MWVDFAVIRLQRHSMSQSMTSGRQAKAVGVPIVPDLSASVANFQTANTPQHRNVVGHRPSNGK
jgi:hypothetical protein